MTFFAVAPHMHELGQHFTASLRQGDEEKILYDDAFNEDAQKFAGFPEVQVHEGDVVDLSCDWFNPTAMPVTLGSAATQEMCSAFIYRYPAGDSSWCMD